MVIRKIRFEFNAIVFNSASKSHNKSNLFQYIWNGVYIGWGEEGGGGHLRYVVHLHTAQLSYDYLYVVLLLSPYISLFYSSFELRVNAKIKSPLGWATFNPKFLA